MFSAFLLGIVQGVTEFLPVSSSGHLVLYQQFLLAPDSEVLFDLVLHLGTLLPVFWLFRRDLIGMTLAPFSERGPVEKRPHTRMLVLLIVGSVPTAAIGLTFEDFFEQLFSTPATLGITFAITGALLYATKKAPPGNRETLGIGFQQALIIGCVQGLAIAPGISRSGSTIAVALFLGLSRPFAARYSFLLSIPAILGAFVLKAADANWSQIDMAPLVLGGLAAATSGYLALTWLLKLVQTGDFSRFCWYCWGMAAFAVGLALAA